MANNLLPKNGPLAYLLSKAFRIVTRQFINDGECVCVAYLEFACNVHADAGKTGFHIK